MCTSKPARLLLSTRDRALITTPAMTSLIIAAWLSIRGQALAVDAVLGLVVAMTAAHRIAAQRRGVTPASDRTLRGNTGLVLLGIALTICTLALCLTRGDVRVLWATLPAVGAVLVQGRRLGPTLRLRAH